LPDVDLGITSTNSTACGLIDLYALGRFPLDCLVTYFELDEVESALAKSYDGSVIKPILRMPA
jgi:aryl-alcohol dehydrogenase